MPPRGRPHWSEVLTVEQVASYLQLNKLTVYRHIREGHLPASKVGKAYRIRKSDVEWFLDSMRARPTARRVTAAVQAPFAPPARREHVAIGASRPAAPSELRDRELSFNPVEWATRGLH